MKKESYDLPLSVRLDKLCKAYAQKHNIGIGVALIIQEEGEERATLAVNFYGEHKPTKLAMYEFIDFIQEKIPTV